MSFELVVPTYNKPQLVTHIIKEYSKQLENIDFILSIHDSSENDDIYNIVSSSFYFNSKIFYYRYDSKIRLDKKVLLGLTASNINYKMLCGDGWVVDVGSILNSGVLNYNYNIICNYEKDIPLYNSYYSNNSLTSRLDKQNFMYDNFWYLIMFGSAIVSNELTKRINVDEMIVRFDVDGFAYPATLAMVADDNNYVCNFHFLTYNPYKVTNTWLSKTILLWCYHLSLTFDHIPDTILHNKDAILKNVGKYTGILTFKGFIHLKVNGCFNYKIYKKYKMYINKTKGCSDLSIILVLLIPRFALVLLKRIKNFII